MSEKLTKLENHVKSHPNDYQSLIGLMKLRSKEIEHRIWLEKVERQKLIAKCKKRLKANEERVSE